MAQPLPFIFLQQTNSTLYNQVEETDSKSITSRKHMSSLFSLVNLQLINTLDLLMNGGSMSFDYRYIF